MLYYQQALQKGLTRSPHPEPLVLDPTVTSLEIDQPEIDVTVSIYNAELK